MVEQRFCKAKAIGSNPLAGFESHVHWIEPIVPKRLWPDPYGGCDLNRSIHRERTSQALNGWGQDFDTCFGKAILQAAMEL